MPIQHSAQYWIAKLSLQPHPEGGFYAETYRSSLVLRREALPPPFGEARSASTAIYFLLEGIDFSAFHRLRSDEMWHFHTGGTLIVHVIDPEGAATEIKLGNDPESGEAFQAVVQAGHCFGSCLKDPHSFALVGCTVAPGFDFADFEWGKRTELVKTYPQHRELILRLTRSSAVRPVR
jgi:predicted cupin superfamily sugar epimerase